MLLKKIFPENLKRQLRVFRSILGSIYYGNPAKDLKLIGVTGSSGKSTTTHLIYHILKENGFKVGLISTVNAEIGNETIDTGFHVTTPDPIQLQKILSIMKNKGAEYVVVECSSHALAQGRLGILRFIAAVFTNITSDHLDWHKTWENYAGSKALLIKRLVKNGYTIINEDDKKSYTFLNNYLRKYRQDVKVSKYTQSEVSNVIENPIGLSFSYETISFKIPVIGKYNVENILAAVKICTTLGVNVKNISDSLKTFKGLPGRMEVMQTNPFTVIVNFAHNTDSLERSLKSIRPFVQSDGKLTVVFGSAGLRDVQKRYTMGEVAAKLADVVVITAEDPRIEKLYDINSQILEGAVKGGGELVKRFENHEEYEHYKSQPHPQPLSMHGEGGRRPGEVGSEVFVYDEESVNSRYDAIDFAISNAKPGDVVITEGKGHEKSLCFGTTEYPFTDQEAVTRALHGSRAKLNGKQLT